MDDEVSDADEKEGGAEKQCCVKAFFARGWRSDSEIKGKEVVDGGLEEVALGVGSSHGFARMHGAVMIAVRMG
jgi:hypothetical protein